MVMAHYVYVRPGLEDLAMDHAFRIGPLLRRDDRVGIEIVFENVVRLHQARCARAREEIAVRISRMAHADMTERIQNAFVRNNPVSGGKITAQVGDRVGQGGGSSLIFWAAKPN